jgi:hypothetical protein
VVDRGGRFFFEGDEAAREIARLSPWNQETSSELWNLRAPNCGTCELRIVELAGCNSVLLREAVMARLLHVFHELLLFSCMAAFVIGVVIAAASIFG